MPAMPRRRVLTIVGLLLLVVVVGVYFGAPRLFLGETGSEFFNPNGWKTRGFFDNNREVFDSTQYVSSMDADGFSEKINMAYQVCLDWFSGWVIDDAPDGEHAGNAFIATLTLNGEVEGQLKYPVSKFGSSQTGAPCWLLTIPFETKLQGQKVGMLEVNMAIYQRDSFGFSKGFYQFAEDRARIVSGAGDCILVGGDEAPFLPGAEITASCDIGHAASGKEDSEGGSGWSLYGDWTSAPIATLGNGPAFSKRVTFTGPTTTGIHEVRLYNGLFDQAKRVFSVTTNLAEAPPPPTVSFDPAGPWVTGQTVSVSWEASPNEQTNAAIVRVHYDIFYVDGTEIASGTRLGSTGSISFNTGGRDVDIRAAIVSEDENGQFSAPTQPTTSVEGCDLYTKCDDNGGIAGLDILWIILLVVAVIIIFLGIFLPFIPLIPWKIIIIFAGVILLLIAVLVFPW